MNGTQVSFNPHLIHSTFFMSFGSIHWTVEPSSCVRLFIHHQSPSTNERQLLQVMSSSSFVLQSHGYQKSPPYVHHFPTPPQTVLNKPYIYPFTSSSSYVLHFIFVAPPPPPFNKRVHPFTWQSYYVRTLLHFEFPSFHNFPLRPLASLQ